jgi:hypothetical protein
LVNRTFDFHCAVEDRERWIIIIFTRFLICSQIWLNLSSDDCKFLYIFLWMIATLATNKNSLKKFVLIGLCLSLQQFRTFKTFDWTKCSVILWNLYWTCSCDF